LDFLNGGRAFERIWLTASAIGLSLQPLGSLPIFMAIDKLPAEQFAAVRPQCRRVASQFEQFYPSARERTLQIAFRIGYAEGPKHRALRRPLADVMGLGKGSESYESNRISN
jgi:hypothetical protein